MQQQQMTEIRWHGRGGQGVVTAGKVLAETALDADLYFQAFPDYGPERAGAPIRAFNRLSDRPISVHCQVETPDVVVVLDPTVMSSVDVTDGLKAEGALIVNTAEDPGALRARLKLDDDGPKVFTVDASHIAIEELGREMTNTPMLGALAAATALFPVDAVVGRIRSAFAKKLADEVIDANIRAVERAASEIKQG